MILLQTAVFQDYLVTYDLFKKPPVHETDLTIVFTKSGCDAMIRYHAHTVLK